MTLITLKRQLDRLENDRLTTIAREWFGVSRHTWDTIFDALTTEADFAIMADLLQRMDAHPLGDDLAELSTAVPVEWPAPEIELYNRLSVNPDIRAAIDAERSFRADCESRLSPGQIEKVTLIFNELVKAERATPDNRV